jgi:GDP-L-fucose synthase
MATEIQRVLVCGATGFIGRNIVEKLAMRPDIVIVAIEHVRPRFQVSGAANPVLWLKGDLRTPSDISRILEDIDIVIQAAATTSGAGDIVSRPYIHVTDNAVMNSYLLREAFEKKVKHFIFFSCSIVYQGSEMPLKETDYNSSTKMHARYFGSAHSKIYIEKLLEFYSSISPMKTTAIRHSNVYGPHDKFDLTSSHVFGATITKVMNAEHDVLVWGTGDEARDLVYIDDLVKFVELVIKRQQSNFSIFNCGSEIPLKIKDLVHKVIALSGKRLGIKYDSSAPTINTSIHLDCTKAWDVLGWSPEVALEEGIARTIAWWESNIGKK